MGEIKDKKYISYFRVSNFKSTLAVIGTSFLYSLFIFVLLMSRSIFKFRAGEINKALEATMNLC